MKIAFKNFLQTLRRYKAASLLNVAGLTLAFTAFYIIMVQVWWELGYNRSLPDAPRILVVNAFDKTFGEKFDTWVGRAPVERAVAASPDVEAVAVRAGWAVGGMLLAQRAGLYERFVVQTGKITLPALEMFGYRTVEGDLRKLAQPNTVIVSRSTAERCGLKTGSTVFVNQETPTRAYEVVGIFEDFPGNTLVSGDEVLANMGEEGIDRPGNWMYHYFIRLRDGADPSAFCDLWQHYYAEVTQQENVRNGSGEKPDDPLEMRLTPVTDFYFASDIDVFSSSEGAKGSWTTTLTLLGIAVLVVVIAFINFVNFFFALIPVRLRTVNIFKVFGAPTSALRFSFLFETVGLVICSLLGVWYLSFFISSTDFANNISTTLAISENLPVVGMVVVLALVMALAAGLYPAWYITSFSPALAAKGSFAGSRRGRRLRLMLVGVQFVIAMGLIVAAVFMQRQHAYVMDYDLGFNQKNLLAFDVQSRKVADARDAFYSALKADPQVNDITCTLDEIVSNSVFNWGRTINDNQATFGVASVAWNFLEVMGIEVYEGRKFLPFDSEQEDQGTVIANRTAQRAYSLKLGDRFGGTNEPIVGFYPDLHFVSLYHGIHPHILYLQGNGWSKNYYLSHYYLRMNEGADPVAVKAHIQQCVDEIDPQVGTIEVQPFEAELAEIYERENNTAAVVTAFSLLAVVIALMGVFGIVLFEIQHRRREIAVRKVMGATTAEILRMFNSRYLRIVAVCFLLAAPVSVWALQRWLSVFAVRVALSWWVFALALAAVAAVTVLTVTACIWRAANENPAESIKSE